MEAIVLSRGDWGEHDQKITLLTKEHGKLEIIARGIKKTKSKNSQTLQIGAFVDAEVAPGKKMIYLTKVQLIESFSKIRTDLQKSMCAMHAVSVTNKMVYESSDRTFFALLISYLYFLHETPTLNAVLPAAYVIKLFSALGFRPVLDRCVMTEESDIVAFSPKDGGVLGKKGLEETKKIGHEVLQCTREVAEQISVLIEDSWEGIQGRALSDAEQVHVKKIIHSFAQFQTNQKISSAYEHAFI